MNTFGFVPRMEQKSIFQYPTLCPGSSSFRRTGWREVDVFLELSCFFDDPVDFGNFFSGYAAFSKTSLNIWKFTVQVLLKPGLENFEHYFTCM